MAKANSGKAQCFTCGKERSTYYCRGCSQDFCFNHLTEHRQILGKQFDEIENDCDQFRQTLFEEKEDPNKHVLLQQISKWEEDSINTIKETAKQCKQILIEYKNNYIIEMENRLTKLAEQVRQTRQEDEFNEIDLNELKSKLAKLTQEFVKPSNISIQYDLTSFINKISVVVSSASTSNTSDGKMLTWGDVQQLAEDKSKCIIVINNRIYDLTKFIDEHPGGEEILKEQHGKDASNAFEDVGHSSDAREQMKAYEIAQLIHQL